jgi:hypothetical protein
MESLTSFLPMLLFGQGNTSTGEGNSLMQMLPMLMMLMTVMQ